MLNIMGVDIDANKQSDEDAKNYVNAHLETGMTVPTTRRQLETEPFSEFDEFNIREEPSLATKNVVYGILSDAHFERKKYLKEQFGTESSGHQFEKDQPRSSDSSESNIKVVDRYRDSINVS